MAAAFHGFNGEVTFTNLILTSLISWSVESSADMAEITDMGDTWKTYLPGFKDWTATVDVLLPTTGIVTTLATELGSTATLTLLTVTASTPTYSGTAFCTGISVSAGTDGPVTATFTFQGSGALAEG